MLKRIKKMVMNSKYYMRPIQDPSKFDLFQSKGFHIVPNHFYYPVPDTSKLPANFFDKQYDFEGIDLNESEQKNLLITIIEKYKKEYSQFSFNKTDVPYEYFWDNGGFQCMDAVSLYGFIRNFKPKHIIEVGGGNTTMLAAQAILKNQSENFGCELITIEPYPWKIHTDRMPGLSQLVVKQVEELPVSFFETLGENDILFIDSSHILKNGHDVTYYFMNLLPHLKRGVIIHFHDIFLPEEYPKDWVMNRHLFFTEQYILRAFLSFNNAFKILYAGRYMQLKFPELTKNALDFYKGKITIAGSFWIQRIK